MIESIYTVLNCHQYLCIDMFNMKCAGSEGCLVLDFTLRRTFSSKTPSESRSPYHCLSSSSSSISNRTSSIRSQFYKQIFKKGKEPASEKSKEYQWNLLKHHDDPHQVNAIVCEGTPLNISHAQILNKNKKEGFLSRLPPRSERLWIRGLFDSSLNITRMLDMALETTTNSEGY